METHDEHKNNIEIIKHSSSSSLSSSPSHEFSFTITQNTTFPYNNKSKTPSNSYAVVDLSPADDIFFHGHLLPLQILSHFSSSSPRSSTNSMDSFTLPIRELFSEDENINPAKDNSSSNNNINTLNNDDNNNNIGGTKVLDGKSKFNFSLFESIKRSKRCRVKEKEDKEKKQKQKKKQLRFDVIHVVKKYFRMVKPLMVFRGQKGKIRMQSKAYSYSGSVTPRNKQDLKNWNWRGQCSAPASMRNSPSNSGLLVATTTPFTPPSDSTMEELQAAIQSAIAHCKNSFSKEDNLKNANNT